MIRSKTRLAKLIASLLVASIFVSTIPKIAYAVDDGINSNIDSGTDVDSSSEWFSDKPSTWSSNENLRAGWTLPNVIYNTTAPSGTLDLRLKPSTTEATKDPITVDIDVHQDKMYEVRYSEIPTIDYQLQESKNSVIGNATITMPDKNVTFDGSGTMTGTGLGTLAGGTANDYEGTKKLLTSQTFTLAIEGWHGSGGYWQFTYNEGVASFIVKDSDVANYFSNSSKVFENTILNKFTLPASVRTHMNKNGNSSVIMQATPVNQDSVYNGEVTTQVDGSVLILRMKPIFQYSTNNWWNGTPVQKYFYNYVNMPKVKTGYGRNYISVMGGDSSLSLLDKYKQYMFKNSSGNLGFNLSEWVTINRINNTTYGADLKNIWSEATLWGGGNLGMRFEFPVKVDFYGITTGTNEDKGSFTGSGSGSLSGTASKDYAIYDYDKDGKLYVSGYSTRYTGISSGYRGNITAGGNINLGGRYSGGVAADVNGNYSGTLKGGAVLKGYSTNEVNKYNLNAIQGKTYKVPYIIPIGTEITLPDGTKVSGNKADFTVTENGTYTVSVRDVGGNTATQKIVINNIDKAKIDVNQFILKESLDGENLKKELKIVPLELNNTIRAYSLKETGNKDNVTYGFFLQVKETALGFNTSLKDEFGALNLNIKNNSDSSITLSKAKDFYNTKVLSEKLNSNTLQSLNNKEDGIYISSESIGGYKTIFFKTTQATSEPVDKIVKLQFTTKAGNTYETTARLQIESNPTNYIVADKNYLLSKDYLSTLHFTRETTINLQNIITLYNSRLSGVSATLTSKLDQNNKTMTDQQLTTSTTFKNIVQYPMILNIEGRSLESYTIETNATSYDDKTNIKNLYASPAVNTLDLVYEPLDTLLNTTTLVTTKAGTAVNVKFNPTIKQTTDIKNLLSKYNIKDSDFKLEVVNYGTKKDKGVVNRSDYATEDEILKNAQSIGTSLNKTTTTDEDIKLLFGIPGVFTDSVDLEKNLSIALPNINDNTPVIVDLKTPFITSIAVDFNNYSYTLPGDFDKLKQDKKIRSIVVNGKEYINESKATITNDLSIRTEGIYPINAKTTSIYGATREVSKTAIIIDANIIANGSRLDNDSTVVITKQGLYDLKANKFTRYNIPNAEVDDKGYSIKGIRLINGDIVLINTNGKEVEILNSEQESKTTFNLQKGALDLVEYRDRVYFAEGTNGLTYIDSTRNGTTPGVKKEPNVDGPIYSLESYSNSLLVGSNGDNALRTYKLTGNDLTKSDIMSAEELFGDNNNIVYNILLRNGRLEVFPDKTNYHIVIDLP